MINWGEVEMEASERFWTQLGSDGVTEYRMLDALTFKKPEQLAEHITPFVTDLFSFEGDDEPGFSLYCQGNESFWVSVGGTAIRISKLGSVGWCAYGREVTYCAGFSTPQHALLYACETL